MATENGPSSEFCPDFGKTTLGVGGGMIKALQRKTLRRKLPGENFFSAGPKKTPKSAFWRKENPTIQEFGVGFSRPMMLSCPPIAVSHRADCRGKHSGCSKQRRLRMAETEVNVKVKLDLPPGVELLGYERYGDGHGFEVKFPLPEFCRCALCGHEEAATYEYKKTVYVVRDLDLWGQPSFLIFQPSFHRCSRCGHRQEHFAPFKRKKVMYTYRFEEYVPRMLIGSNEEEVAGRLGISAETVALIVENQLKDDKQIDPERVIAHMGFDEISLKKRHKLYVTLMTDLTHPESPKVLAVAPGKNTVAAKKCLGKLTPQQRSAVQTHRVDMGKVYGPVCNGLLPGSRMVVDRFHVAKHFNDVVGDFRKKPRGSTKPSCRRPSRSGSVR
jgi:hypothetical protein